MMKQRTNITGTLCPSCGLDHTKNLGKLSNNNGLIVLSDPGCLYECLNCGLLFRRPYLPPSELFHQYAELPQNAWDDQKRIEFSLAAGIIRNAFPSGNILDVGCLSGSFLRMFPQQYQKYGVEPSQSARSIAESYKIIIVGNAIELIDIHKPMFHAITILDVLEHLPDPFGPLQMLRKLLLPGGLLIISTGNTNTLPWKLMRLDYWYYFTEHVSFFNLGWFRWVAMQLNLKIVFLKKFSHFKSRVFEPWHQLLGCFIFMITQHALNYPYLHWLVSNIYPFSRVSKWPFPPKSHFWKDHMFVVLRTAE